MVLELMEYKYPAARARGASFVFGWTGGMRTPPDASKGRSVWGCMGVSRWDPKRAGMCVL